MTTKERVIDVDDSKYRTTVVQQAAASCSGALITSIFVTPLDVVKIRLQTQQKHIQKSKCFLYCNGLMDHFCPCEPGKFKNEWFQRPGHFTGTIDAFIKITRNEGVTSLWSGLSPTLVLALPATIAYFVTYEQLRLRFKDYCNRNRKEGDAFVQPFWIPLASGAIARTFSVTVVSPLELIRTKMQSTKLSYFEIGEALKLVVKKDGYMGLWRGVFPTLLRDVPFSAIYWSQYEALKKWYGPGVPSFWFSFVAGFLAGGVASILTLPFDVIKTHQQIEIGEQHLYGAGEPKSKSQSTLQMMQQLHRQHGLRSLFTGLVPRLIKVAPACAIMVSTFEHGKVVFNRLGNYTFGTQQNDSTKDKYDVTNSNLMNKSKYNINKTSKSFSEIVPTGTNKVL
ncbi:hypothetical protein RN001_006213 [Aquatica leii]|uniref:Solute carrier family 25 member 40 n=1 Tax=Aquatica leii TaxID=1421715 RepID=A0AAN7PDE0_9COLE|nr:hypothetical protein RN001_006213 [Aquatica leii]